MSSSRSLRNAPLIAAISLVACQPETAGYPGGAAAGLEGLLDGLATYGPPLLGYVVLRRVALRSVLARMMQKRPSEGQLSKELGGADGGQGAAPAEGDPDRKGATEAEPGPELPRVDLDVESRIGLDGVFQERRLRAMHSAVRSWGTFALATLAFVVVALGVSSAYGPDLQGGSGATSGQMMGAMWPVLIIGVAVFSAVLTGASASVLGRVSMISAALGLLALIAVSALAVPMLGVPRGLALLPAVLAAGTFALLHARRVRAARADKNSRLLVLRVFGSDRNTAGVFGELTRRWSSIGGYATIVDPSFVRYRFSLSYPRSGRRLLRFMAIYGGFIAALSMLLDSSSSGVVQQFLGLPALSLPAGETKDLVGIVAWIVLVPLAFVPVRWYVQKRFFSSADALRGRFEGLRTAKADWRAQYEGRPFYCFDDVWRPAVQGLLESAEAVLMDLRGYTRERRGCEYELGLLADGFPLSRAVFLVDDDETRDLVLSTLSTKLAVAAEGSPNAGTEAPTLTFYRPGDRDPGDIERLVALLSAAAGDADGLPGEIRTEPAGRSWLWRIRGFFVWLGSRRDAWAEALDMAVARPPLSKIVTPLLILALAGLFFHRVAALRPEGAAFLPAELEIREDGTRVLRTTATHGGFDPLSRPEVRAELRGGAAGDATHYGEVEITRAVDPVGAPLQILRVEPPFALNEELLGGMYPIRRGKGSLNGVQVSIQPPGGVALVFLFHPTDGLTRVAEISGTVALRSGERPVERLAFEVRDVDLEKR